MSRLPSLGSRGEGWVVAQLAIAAAFLTAARHGPAWRGPARIASSLVGGALIATGAVMGLAGARDLGGNLTAAPRPRARGGLVETGIYALVRHPIYGAQLLLTAGWALVAASPRAIALLPAAAGFLTLKSMREETWLVERFPRYAAYRHHTRRFVPGLW